jgi:hypothetical protein
MPRMVSKISRTKHDLKGAAHGGTLIVIGIPRSTKQAFKRTTVGKETIRDAIIRLMRYYVRVKGNIPTSL